MSDSVTSPSIDRDEHASDVKAKKVLPYGWTGTTAQKQPTPFITQAYDYVAVTYPDATTDVFTFKTGGSSGTTVQTVTIVYTDSTKASLVSVTRT